MDYGSQSALFFHKVFLFVTLDTMFCCLQSDGSSHGVRQFIQQDVVQFAKQNPSTVVYLKPRSHRLAFSQVGDNNKRDLTNYLQVTSVSCRIFKWREALDESTQFQNG